MTGASNKEEKELSSIEGTGSRERHEAIGKTGEKRD